MFIIDISPITKINVMHEYNSCIHKHAVNDSNDGELNGFGKIIAT